MWGGEIKNWQTCTGCQFSAAWRGTIGFAQDQVLNLFIAPIFVLEQFNALLVFAADPKRTLCVVIDMTHVADAQKSRDVCQGLLVTAANFFRRDRVAAVGHPRLDAIDVQSGIARQDKVAPNEISLSLCGF